MIYLYILAAFFFHVGLTLLFYMAVMALLAARNAQRLGVQPLKAFAYGVLYVGYFLDMTLSLFWGTILFLDLPQETLLTIRLIRYKRTQPTSWRGKFASWICEKLLDPISPDGCHCKV